MNEEDRKAFEEWCERELIRPASKPVAEFAWLASREHARKDVDELVDVATGKTRHVYMGSCPDETQHDTLDPDCPACQVIAKLKDQP